MQKILAINKPSGLTPLEVIIQIRQLYPALKDKKIGYAGRLDPLARGVLLLMLGEETKKRIEYLSLPKIYEFEILFGLQTDTYDILGYLEDTKTKQVPINVNIFVNSFVNRSLGKQLQKYPPYSSKTIDGKPLFWWAKNDKLNKIEIPTHEIEIFEFIPIATGEIQIKELEERVKKIIASVHGDFRQQEILKRWEQLFSQKIKGNCVFTTAKFRISCSSGTYIRELVNQLGKKIDSGAITLDILRTQVGEYTLDDALVLKKPISH